MLRRCPRCGNNFEGIKEQRLCPECRAAAQKEPRLIPHICKTCGVEFIGGPSAMYCPACRAERKKAADARKKAAAKNGRTRKIGSTDICQRCGQPYIVAGGLQRYCPTCGPIVVAEKAAPKKRVYAAKRRKEDPEYKHRLKETGTVCVICGKAFTATTPTNTCSPECARELRKIRQRGADLKRRPRKCKNNESNNGGSKC